MPPIYVSFGDKLIELKVKQKNEMVATVFKIGFRSVEPENELLYTGKKNIKIISARSVVEELTGETIPCFLIQQASHLYLFALNSDLTKFVPLRKVNGLEAADCETLILDGPALLFATTKLVSIYYSDDIAMCILKKQHYKLPAADEKVCSCVKNDVHSRSNQTKSLVYVSALHVSYIHHKYLLFLKHAKMCNCSQTKSGLFVLEWSSVNGFILLSNKEFVPEEYHSSLTCLYHYEQKKLQESMHKIVQTVILGTNDGFVIMIENGHLLNCVSLCSESLIPLPRPIDKICFSVNKICSSKDTVLVIQDDRVFGLNREFQVSRL